MAEDLYCICRRTYDQTQFMIQCDACDDWFHGSCVGVEEWQANDIEIYHCPNCSPDFGPFTLKKRQNYHRHDHSDQKAQTKAVQTGTLVFIKQLKSKQFSSAENILQKCHGRELGLDFLMKKGFRKPILVETKDGLGMVVPDRSFTVADVQRYVGPSIELDIIDVTKQNDLKMRMMDWTAYFRKKKRDKTLNVISLEFSRTSLSQLVHAPRVVREMDWVNRFWPEHAPDESPCHPRPCVQKYCLMGVKDSYTDFHIDFGGSSVWYHVLWGEKIFYFAEPTETNLKLYEKWVTSSKQSEVFFADLITRCYKVSVKPGQTLFIPTGWIHAVYTSVDTLVFGGNFLHSYNIELQLSVYDMEVRLKTPSKYLFTYFETVHWHAAVGLIDELKNLHDSGEKKPQLLIDGIHSLLSTLKQWISKKGGSLDQHKMYIPEGMDYNKVIKSLSKELKQAEKPSVVVHEQKPVIKIKNPMANTATKTATKKATTTAEPSRKSYEDAPTTTTTANARKRAVRPSITAPLRLKIPKNGKEPEATKEKLAPANLKLVVSNGRIVSGKKKSAPESETKPKEDESLSNSYSCQQSHKEPLRLTLSMNGRESFQDDRDVNVEEDAFTSIRNGAAVQQPPLAVFSQGQTTAANTSKTVASKRNPISVSIPPQPSQDPSSDELSQEDGGRRSRLNSPIDDDDDDVESELERFPSDPDFVYPTVEDDEIPSKVKWKPGMKKKKSERVDATWNPKGRVSRPSVKESSRPVRAVSRKPELEMLNAPKNNNVEKEKPLTSSSGPDSPSSSSKSSNRAPLRPSGNQPETDKGNSSKRGRRPVQLTTKQRLAKKLKLDKGGGMFLR